MRMLLMLTLFFFPWVVCAEETPAAQGDASKTKPSPFASFSQRQNGQFTLDIDYPWHRFTKASIEVRLISKEDVVQLTPRPLLFIHHWFNGETSAKVGKCLDGAYSLKTVDHVTCDTLPFDIVADRNVFGKPAVFFAYQSGKHLNKGEEEKEAEKLQQGVSVIFCELENWSQNRHQLKLDLLPEYFSKPGQLYVWFLRDDSIVWSANLDWKGYR